MPVIKSETIHGKTYILSDNLDIWRIEFGMDGQPTIQRLDTIAHEQVEGMLQPTFSRWIDK